MSNPTIQFHYNGDDDDEPRDVVASVWPVLMEDDGAALDDPILKNKPISFMPSVSHSYGSSVQVPAPGQYLVDVRLPNGRRVRRTILVDDKTPYQFSIRSGHRMARSALEELPSLERSLYESRDISILQSTRASDLKVVLVDERSSIEGRTGLAALVDVARSMTMADPTMSILSEAQYATTRQRVRIDARENRGHQEGFESYTRRWVGVFGQGRLETITPLPSPWLSLESPAILELLLDRTEGNAAHNDAILPLWQFHLKVGDPQWASMIEYLTRRDIGASQAVMGTAIELLAEKIRNPFAAAAGAYVIALNPDAAYSEETANWPSWINNLSTWFPWLPDGQIAQGWILLRAGERGRKSWVEARANFLEAVRRGLPYFSTGLRLLSDGLTTLTMTSEPDPEVELALNAVRAAQWSMDPQEAFTTIRVLGWPGVNDPIMPGVSISQSPFASIVEHLGASVSSSAN